MRGESFPLDFLLSHFFFRLTLHKRVTLSHPLMQSWGACGDMTKEKKADNDRGGQKPAGKASVTGD